MNLDRDFTRQSFLGAHSEKLLSTITVAIVGLGGGGSHIAQQLAHVGVGRFRLIDPDNIEASNLNRLVGATMDDVEKGVAKVEIAKRLIQGIRPWADVRVAKNKWQEVDHLVRDANIVFGCVDGYLQRDYLETATRRFCVPYIDVGMDITEFRPNNFAVAGQMIVSLPGNPCMRCMGFLTPEKLAQEENRYGDVGINPQVIWTNGTLASLAVGAFIKLVAPWDDFSENYTWLELDGNNQTVTRSQVPSYVLPKGSCPHHGGSDGLGDPFFDLRKVKMK